ncbi:hypothetical protein FB475_2238 [Kribbella jejuensis]|uniref:Uncharacterized protein n=1 Tax=Kribbella jejuensis TaxID=236068 RepID=A0A542ES87_9ACTN|nr:hypothetical protein FB475_2238 [Kribbella jejuensis]
MRAARLVPLKTPGTLPHDITLTASTSLLVRVQGCKLLLQRMDLFLNGL